MRILWCHEVSYLDKPVYEYQDFPERLAARGHEVEVIDFVEHAATTGDSQRVSRTGEGEVALSSIPHSGLPVIKYLEARLRFRRMLRQRLRRGDVDAAFIYSVFINGTETVKACREAGVPVIYRVLDAYHRLRPGTLTRSMLLAGERYIYRNADCVLTTNEQMSEYVSSLTGEAVNERLRVVDHGVDCKHFSPRPADSALAQRYGIAHHDRVVVFLGTTYSFSGLLELVERLPSLLEQEPRLKLMIVGGGEQDAALQAARERLGLSDRLILTGMVPYADVPAHLSLGKIAINPFQINDITRDIVPIKLLQYQAMGLPVVCTPLPDVMKKYPEGKSGIVYASDDQPDTFSGKLGVALGEYSLRLTGIKGLELMRSQFSVERAVDRIEEMMRTLATGRNQTSA